MGMWTSAVALDHAPIEPGRRTLLQRSSMNAAAAHLRDGFLHTYNY